MVTVREWHLGFQGGFTRRHDWIEGAYLMPDSVCLEHDDACALVWRERDGGSVERSFARRFVQLG
jgi:hypothetical protein